MVVLFGFWVGDANRRRTVPLRGTIAIDAGGRPGSGNLSAARGPVVLQFMLGLKFSGVAVAVTGSPSSTCPGCTVALAPTTAVCG